MTVPLTIVEAARLIAARKLSPVELTRLCLDRIERLDSRLNAFITLDRDGAIAAARRAEADIMAGGPSGPLHGIPVGLKDVFDQEALPTTGNSRLLKRNLARADSAVAARLRGAGAVLMGKLATHEFALGGPSFDLPWPPARNPWEPTRFTGGSSSGPAAAIASGMVLAAIGSDTAGSIRSPAALCGVTGFKPSSGLVSRFGMLPLSETLDHAGPMAWTAEDCALVLQAIAGPDTHDSAAAAPSYGAGLVGDVKGVRIGVLRHVFERDRRVSDPLLGAIEAALAVLAGLGCEIRTVETAPLADWHAAGFLIVLAEGYALHEAPLRARPDLYGEIMRDRISLGALVSSADYLAARRRLRALVRELRNVTAEVDILLTVSQPGEAPLLTEVSKWDGFAVPGYNIMFNMTGGPAVSVRCGFGPQGLPLGLQLAAAPGQDSLLLRVAHAYAGATPWQARRPPIFA